MNCKLVDMELISGPLATDFFFKKMRLLSSTVCPSVRRSNSRDAVWIFIKCDTRDIYFILSKYLDFLYNQTTITDTLLEDRRVIGGHLERNSLSIYRSKKFFEQRWRRVIKDIFHVQNIFRYYGFRNY
jgi:hypothetical protein